MDVSSLCTAPPRRFPTYTEHHRPSTATTEKDITRPPPASKKRALPASENGITRPPSSENGITPSTNIIPGRPGSSSDGSGGRSGICAGGQRGQRDGGIGGGGGQAGTDAPDVLAVDAAQERLGRGGVAGADGIGVARAVAADVGQGLLEAVHQPHRQEIGRASCRERVYVLV